jgi:chorismate dehydratase
MKKIRISAVKYANTYPFIWGLKESGFDRKVIIETDHPSDCARKVIERQADIGLIPVAAIPQIPDANVIGNYCIGATGKVRTVMLLSNCPFNEIVTINLDYRSRSSVNLTKVLAKNMWKREFKWVGTDEKFDFLNIGRNEAVVLIGDQCFRMENQYKEKVDLAEEWKRHTDLPFVFAGWVANCRLEEDFIEEFNNALKLGVENIDKVAHYFRGNGIINEEELRKYLTVNIDYPLDDDKRKGMALFLKLLKEL